MVAPPSGPGNPVFAGQCPYFDFLDGTGCLTCRNAGYFGPCPARALKLQVRRAGRLSHGVPFPAPTGAGHSTTESDGRGIHQPRNGGYRVRYRVRGESRSKSFPTMKAARDFRAQVEADLAAGTAVDPRHARMTLRAWAREWHAARLHLRPSTQAKRTEGKTTASGETRRAARRGARPARRRTTPPATPRGPGQGCRPAAGL